MAKSVSGYPSQLLTTFNKFTLKQKVGLLLSAVVSVVALIILVTWANKPTYGILFSNLEAKDASKIVDKLKQESVPYKLGDDGKAILVPKDRVYELRLQMAGQGLPQSSIVGYSIFDKPSFGLRPSTLAATSL